MGPTSAVCPCRGLSDPLEQARCLAPPPGDYEVVLPAAAPGVRLVLNSEGYRLRSTAADEWLPFLTSVERPASRAAVEQALRVNGVSPEKLLCMAVEALWEAARAGSMEAAEKLRGCRDLVGKILRGCGAGGEAAEG